MIDTEENQLIVSSLLQDKLSKFPILQMENPDTVCILPNSTILIGDRR